MKETKIRVLNIQETIRSGGVERRRLSLAKLLDKSKFELKIICTHKRGNIGEAIEQEGVEIIEIGNFDSPFHWSQHKKVQKVIDEFKPHIIHGAVFEGVTMAAVNGFIKRVPIIILEETSDPKTRSWKANLLMKFFSIFADKVVGVSPASVNYLTNIIKVNSKKVLLINNGVALPKMMEENQINTLKKQYQIDNEIIIGSVGRLIDDNTKKFSDLIKAFQIVNIKHPKIKLIIVGEGKERNNYQQLAIDLGIEKDVIFAGYQEEIHQYYHLFSIFSLVSAHESFGLVLAEAMLHKLPVVATRVGGMQYIVDDKKTGFLVSPGNIEEITNSLEQLVSNSKLRQELGNKGYDKAMREYTEELYVKKVEGLYIELYNKRTVKG